MASSKISQLPVQVSSGTTILDELAVVNSGETLTSKITLQAFNMSSGNTIGATVGFDTGYVYYPIMSFNNDVNNFDRFVSINSDEASSEFNTRQCTDISSSKSRFGNFLRGGIFASNQVELRNNGSFSAVIASQCNIGNQVRGILGSTNSAIIASLNGDMTGGQSNFLAGTQSCIMGAGAGLSAMIASEACSHQGSQRSFIAASYASLMDSNAEFNGIMGGRENKMTQDQGERRWIICAENTEMNNTANNTVVLNGFDVDITGSTEGMTFVSMSAHTADIESYEWTTHSDNLYSYGQISQGVQTIPSGDTFSVNMSSGGIVELFLTGNSTCALTNVREGSTYSIYITSSGGHTFTPSASGFTFKIAGGSYSPTSGGTDCIVLDVVGSIIYQRNFANFS